MMHEWAYLSRVVEGPHWRIQELLADTSVEEIARGIRQAESWLGPELLAASAARRDVAWEKAQEDLGTAHRLNFRVIHPGHPEWPDLVAPFGFIGGESIVAPHALWVRGGDLRRVCERSVSIVGTRAVSSYGARVTEELVGGLSPRWTVVSGGALGVDAVAHREAIARGGATVVVQAGGLDRCYPTRHRELFDSIVDSGGVIVSEYPPGSPPQRHRFLERNRLIAALSQGCVVVEAAWRSGALSTLTWAEKMGRVTMAIPGPVTSAQSMGCHQRIRENRAQLVTSAEEIVELIGKIGEVDTAGQYELEFAPSEIQRLDRVQLRIYDAMGFEQATTQDIAVDAGIGLTETLEVLMALESKGLAHRQGVHWARVRV